MATKNDKTPPSARSTEETGVQGPKEGTLVIATPAQASGKRPRKENMEGAKRLHDLEVEAATKQAELEDILLRMKEEKGKAKQAAELEEEAGGTDLEESYDRLYSSSTLKDNFDDDGFLEKQQSGSQRRYDHNLRAVDAQRQLTRGPHEKRHPRYEKKPSKAHRRVDGTKELAANPRDQSYSEESSSSDGPTPIRARKPIVPREDAPWLMQEGLDLTTRGMARRALGKISASPFTEDICEAEPPRKFQMPRFTIYDGKSDPLAHYRHYMQAMTLWSNNDELMCRVFPSTLGDTALQWFHKLPPRSIGSWG